MIPLILIFVSIALSITKANDWILIPNFCIIICWVLAIFHLLIYSYAKTIVDKINKENAIEIAKLKKERTENNAPN